MANATTRAKRLNETKMILRHPLLLIAIILSFALLLLFVIYPLAKTLIYSLTDETGAFSLANLITILQTPRYGKMCIRDSRLHRGVLLPRLLRRQARGEDGPARLSHG